MMLKLISATPSPYARKVRIALHEKGIPFTLITEVPWNSTTQTPQYNPLEKLPVLIVPAEGIKELNLPPSSDGKPTSIYESHFILSWLDATFPSPMWPSMLPSSVSERLAAQEVEVVCDGICDAFVLRFWEMHRSSEHQSKEWIARQQRKIDGGMKWLAGKAKGNEFLVGDEFGLADIAAGTVCLYLDVRWPEYGWRESYSELARYVDRLGRRESFRGTVPVPQVIGDKIV